MLSLILLGILIAIIYRWFRILPKSAVFFGWSMSLYQLTATEWNALPSEILQVGDRIEFSWEPFCYHLVSAKHKVEYETKSGVSVANHIVSLDRIKREESNAQ